MTRNFIGEDFRGLGRKMAQFIMKRPCSNHW
jgi:hypothetical protein